MDDWTKALYELPGELYLSVLQKIHKTLHPKTYLEIGVAKGESLALAEEGTFAVGIDPEPCIVTPLKAWTRIYKMTSNAFFEQYKGPPFDLIFIDGLHRYEAIVEDFCHAEKQCTPNSIMLLHDTIPLSEETSTPVCHTSFWTGNVWKIVPAILKFRPDLTLFTIGCPPSGLTVIRGFGKNAGLSREVIKEFEKKDFNWIANQKKEALKIIDNNTNAWLPKLI